MVQNLDFEDVAPAIKAGLENIGKWYRKTDETDAYFICMGTPFSKVGWSVDQLYCSLFSP